MFLKAWSQHHFEKENILVKIQIPGPHLKLTESEYKEVSFQNKYIFFQHSPNTIEMQGTCVQTLSSTILLYKKFENKKIKTSLTKTSMV